MIVEDTDVYNKMIYKFRLSKDGNIMLASNFKSTDLQTKVGELENKKYEYIDDDYCLDLPTFKELSYKLDENQN